MKKYTLAALCIFALLFYIRIGRKASRVASPPPEKTAFERPKADRKSAITSSRAAATENQPSAAKSYFSMNLVDDHGIGLTAKDANSIAKLYNAAVARRQEVEIRLAKADAVSASEELITIPAYKAEGAEIWDDFVNELSFELGTQKAAEFIDYYGDRLRADNAGFGQNEQQVLVDATSSGYHIVHTTSSSVDMLNGPMLVKSTSTSEQPYGTSDGRYNYLSGLFPSPSNI